jgi:hypothetical protein
MPKLDKEAFYRWLPESLGPSSIVTFEPWGELFNPWHETLCSLVTKLFAPLVSFKSRSVETHEEAIEPMPAYPTFIPDTNGVVYAAGDDLDQAIAVYQNIVEPGFDNLRAWVDSLTPTLQQVRNNLEEYTKGMIARIRRIKAGINAIAKGNKARQKTPCRPLTTNLGGWQPAPIIIIDL